jgi:hypothetical protein
MAVSEMSAPVAGLALITHCLEVPNQLYYVQVSAAMNGYFARV